MTNVIESGQSTQTDINQWTNHSPKQSMQQVQARKIINLSHASYNWCLARENTVPVLSAGKHATSAKRGNHRTRANSGKTWNLYQKRVFYQRAKRLQASIKHGRTRFSQCHFRYYCRLCTYESPPEWNLERCFTCSPGNFALKLRKMLYF